MLYSRTARSARVDRYLDLDYNKDLRSHSFIQKHYYIKDIIKCGRAVRALPAMIVLSKTLYNYRHSYLDGDTDRICPKRNESIKAAVQGLSEISTESSFSGSGTNRARQMDSDAFFDPVPY